MELLLQVVSQEYPLKKGFKKKEYVSNHFPKNYNGNVKQKDAVIHIFLIFLNRIYD